MTLSASSSPYLIIFHICGPHSMLKDMQIMLQEDLEIPKERIKVEEFTGY